MDDLLQSKVPSLQSTPTRSSTESVNDLIQKVIKEIEPYIYGGTPMCKGMNDALRVFQRTNAESKVLFILSDGQSADGDPRPIAHELRRLGVSIVTCFLTSDCLRNPKCLYGEVDPKWGSSDGRSTLFEMSSTMQNMHTPVSYLVDAGWELSPSGISHLSIQANILDVVNEFCRIVVSQMTKSCDALIDILEKVPLATYINQKNDEFEAKKQEGGTCYANAIAAVFHLAMHRIISREGGIPGFYTIRQRLIHAYGINGANTKKVLANVSPEYRLHFHQVDETGARKAINERRPVVATYFLYEKQRKIFKTFYKYTPKGILNKRDVTGGSDNNPGGHAVVLVKCNPDSLMFMNSWGQSFADEGFFQVKDQTVLNDMKFYDVYWTLDDLTENEKEAYTRKGAKRGQELLQKFPSLQDLPYECPICNRISNVGHYSGDLLELQCPKCQRKFEPTNEDLIRCLQLRPAHNDSF